MKKVIFSLIAIVLFSGFSYGQEQTLKNLSTEKQSEIMQSQMLTVVNTLSVFYTKGQTYEQFLKSIEISNPTKPVDDFFRRVYYYISNGKTSSDIMMSKDVVFTNLSKEFTTNPLYKSNSSNTSKKKWWQNLINLVLNVAIDIYLPDNDINVDLWP